MKRSIILASLLMACGSAEHAPIYVEPVADGSSGASAVTPGVDDQIGQAGSPVMIDDAGAGGVVAISSAGQHAGGSSAGISGFTGDSAGTSAVGKSDGGATSVGGSGMTGGSAGNGGQATAGSSNGGSIAGTGSVGGQNGGTAGSASGGTGGGQIAFCDLSDRDLTWTIIFTGDTMCFDVSKIPSVILPGFKSVQIVSPQHPTWIDPSTEPTPPTCYGYMGQDTISSDHCELIVSYKTYCDPGIGAPVHISIDSTASNNTITGTISGDCSATFVATR